MADYVLGVHWDVRYVQVQLTVQDAYLDICSQVINVLHAQQIVVNARLPLDA